MKINKMAISRFLFDKFEPKNFQIMLVRWMIFPENFMNFGLTDFEISIHMLWDRRYNSTRNGIIPAITRGRGIRGVRLLARIFPKNWEYSISIFVKNRKKYRIFVKKSEKNRIFVKKFWKKICNYLVLLNYLYTLIIYNVVEPGTDWYDLNWWWIDLEWETFWRLNWTFRLNF